MVDLTDEMKGFLNSNLAWVATISKEGQVDLGPKMSMFIIDNNHIGYHERTAGQTYRNLLDGSDLVVAVANLEQKKGYRFRGNVVLHSDDAIYDEQVKVAEERGTKKPMTIPVLWRSRKFRISLRALRQAKPSSRTDRFHTEPVETTISENRRRDCMSGLRFAVIGTEDRESAAYRSRRFDHGFLYGSCMYGLWISVDKCSLIHLSTDFLKEVAGEYWFLPCWSARISEDAYATTNNQRR